MAASREGLSSMKSAIAIWDSVARANSSDISVKSLKAQFSCPYGRNHVHILHPYSLTC
jgi:hypothetical protein